MPYCGCTDHVHRLFETCQGGRKTVRYEKVNVTHILIKWLFKCFKVYQWQSCDSLHEKKEKTDKRREELLDLLYDNSSSELEGICIRGYTLVYHVV